MKHRSNISFSIRTNTLSRHWLTIRLLTASSSMGTGTIIGLVISGTVNILGIIVGITSFYRSRYRSPSEVWNLSAYETKRNDTSEKPEFGYQPLDRIYDISHMGDPACHS